MAIYDKTGEVKNGVMCGIKERETAEIKKDCNTKDPLDELRKMFLINKKKFDDDYLNLDSEMRALNMLILSLEEYAYFTVPVCDNNGEEEVKRLDGDGEKIEEFSMSGEKGKNQDIVEEKERIRDREYLRDVDKKRGQCTAEDILEYTESEMLLASLISNSNQNDNYFTKTEHSRNSHKWIRSPYSLSDIKGREMEINNPVYRKNNDRNRIKAYTCKIKGCSKSYTSMYGLKYHAQHGHNKVYDEQIKPFSCEIKDCNKRYKNANGLKYHLENGHKNDKF